MTYGYPFLIPPLLQEVTLQGAPHLHMANWGGVKNLDVANVYPQSLAEDGGCMVIAHLIMHMPIRCFQLTFPNGID